MPFVLPRLYAILDTDIASARGLEPLGVLDAWLDAGVELVQLRAKSLASGEMLELADHMQERVRRGSARLIVNDRADIARMSGAAGVHVGQDDLSASDVRRVLGTEPIVGLSTHNPDQVESALLEPVNYVAIGPVFPTLSKGRPTEAAIDVAGVSQAAARTAEHVPLVAIGGITLARAREILDAGASSIAVISDLLVGNVRTRARDYIRTLA